MLPYSRGLIFENAPNYEIMKTEAVFGFGPSQDGDFENNNFNSTKPLRWIFSNSSIQKRSLSEPQPTISVSKSYKKNNYRKSTEKSTSKKSKHKKKKNKKRNSKKINKCIIKFEKGGEGGQYTGKKRKRRRGGGKYQNMKKKYMIPLIIGVLAAKSLLTAIALKFLAFMSAKGLMMGFFSTILASLISLKGMFHYPHESSKRNDDAKTQVEIIQVPSKSEDHVYYDEHYKRGDYIPVFPANDILVYDNYNNVLQKKTFKTQKNNVPRYENKVKKNTSTSPPRV